MDQLDLGVSLRVPFEIGQCNVSDIRLRNVTRLDLGFCQSPIISMYSVFAFLYDRIFFFKIVFF